MKKQRWQIKHKKEMRERRARMKIEYAKPIIITTGAMLTQALVTFPQFLEEFENATKIILNLPTNNLMLFAIHARASSRGGWPGEAEIWRYSKQRNGTKITNDYYNMGPIWRERNLQLPIMVKSSYRCDAAASIDLYFDCATVTIEWGPNGVRHTIQGT